MDQATGLTSLERKLLAISVVMMLWTAPFVVDPSLFERIFPSADARSGEVVGEIAEMTNDVRLKESQTYVWSRTPPKILRRGDSIFSGEKSGTKLCLADGVEVELGENSLLRLDVRDGQRIPELRLGTVRVQGPAGKTAQVVIDGEVVEIKMTGKAETIRLEQEVPKVAARRAKKTEAAVRTRETIRAADLLSKVMKTPPVPLPDDAVFTAFVTVDDRFEKRGDVFVPRERPRAPRVPVRLRWKDLEASPHQIQISRDDAFTALDADRRDVRENDVTHDFSPGAFAWRVSRGDAQWSDIQKLEVREGWLAAEPKILPSERDFVHLGQPISASLKWEKNESLASVLVEASASPAFPPAQTTVYQVTGQELVFRNLKEGVFYARATGVDATQRLTPSTVAVAFTVKAPPLLGEVKLPSRKLAFKAAQAPAVSWTAPQGSRNAIVEVFNADKERIETVRTETHSAPLKAREPGLYYYRVTAVDQWGRPGATAAVKPFEILEPEPSPPMEAAQVVARVEARVEAQVEAQVEAKREPAQAPPEPPAPAPSLAAEVKPPKTAEAALPSVLQAEAGTFTVLSSEQTASSRQVPTAATATVRWKTWWDRLGVEWSFQSKAFDLSAAPAGSPMSLEARAVSEFADGRGTGFFGSVEFQGLLGAEIYRNSGAGNFLSPSADLLKVGFNMEFPLWRKWTTGGEVLLGFGSDASKKTEISGRLNYVLDPKWMLGVGYRASAFEAGSEKSAPGALPYREATVQGFTSLRYLY